MSLADTFATAARSATAQGNIVRAFRWRVPFVGSMRWLLGFVASLLVWQMLLFFALLDQVIELDTYAWLHLFGCLGLVTFLVWRSSALDDRYHAALQIVGWSALAGPFGTFVAIALTLPSKAAKSSVMSEEGTGWLTTDRSTIERIERMHVTLLDHRGRLEGACRVRPLIDVMVEGSQSEKLEALSVIYRKYEAKLSAVLKRALRDRDTSVRVLAATVVAKLHATYSREIGNCQAVVTVKPNLPQNWRDLAEARLSYAESGLLEGARARAQIESAIGDLSRAVELDPADAASVGRKDWARRLTTYGGHD